MKIAVVGGGISGLSAALILSARYEVHLFEADGRLGGHAHTVNIDSGKNTSLPVDTGFLVYNTLTYPHFTRFLDYLGVQTVSSDMSLSIKSLDGIEWSGTNLKTVFAQSRNLLRPSFLAMLFDILRFNKRAEENLILSRSNRWSLEDLLREGKFGKEFQRLYLLPMTGAIWSMSYSDALRFPAETFLNFCINHRLLQVANRPLWRTIQGGSVNYVNQVRRRLSHVHSSARIESVRLNGNKLVLHMQGSEAEFDRVVFATHAPTTRSIISHSFADLADFISPLKVTSNRVFLHEDSSMMPQNKSCWSSWNVQAQSSVHDKSDISLTYYLNMLQPLDSDRQHFITLNSNHELNKVVQKFNYDHPQFDFRAIDIQKRLPEIQGQHGLYFAGAWTRYGFHEDGILSAVNVAQKLGVSPQWT